MPSTLLVGPPGDSTREPFFARLVDACRDPDKAVGFRYLVPTARRRADVEARCLAALDDGDAICLPRIQTLDAFAQEVFALASPARVISWRAAAMLVERVLAATPDEFPVLTHGRPRPFAGLVAALVAMIREIKRYGVSLDALGRVAGHDAKTGECANVLRRYTDLLAAHGWVDQQDTVLFAAEHLRDDAFRARALADTTDVVLDGFVEFSPAERPLVDALADAANTVVVLDRDAALERFFPSVPHGFGPSRPRDHQSPFLHLARVALGAAVEAPVPTSRPASLIDASTSEDELERIAGEVKRRLLDGVPQDEIALVVPNLDETASLVRETFAAYGIPCAIAAPVPLSESPVAAAVRSLVQVPASGFQRKALVGLLRSPFVAFRGHALEELAPVVDELARSMRIFGGSREWCDGLRRRIAYLEKSTATPALDFHDEDAPADSGADEVLRLKRAEAILPELVAALSSLREQRTLADHLHSLRELIQQFDVEASCRRADAASSAMPAHTRCFEELMRALEETELLDRAVPASAPATLEDFADIVSSVVASVRIGPPIRPLGVEVLDLRAAGSRRAKVLFVTGLVEQAVPAAPHRDPLLSAAVRAALGLPDAERLRADAWLDVYRALAAASDELVLSRPTAKGDASLLESPALERLRTALHLELAASSHAPMSRRGLFAALGHGHADTPSVDVLLASDQFPADSALHTYAHAAAVESLRAASIDSPSPYAGTLSARVLDEVRQAYDAEHEYSATELERYVRCPFRFFAEYLLTLKEPEEPEEDIPARDKGNLLHRIFRAFYARRLDERSTAPLGEEELRAAFEQLVAVAGQECAREPYTGLLWDKFRQRLIGAGSDVPGLLRRFLDVEVATMQAPAPCTPRYLELGFGRQRHPALLDPDSRDEPVEIDAGTRTIRLHGIIDRIDVNDEAGTFCVLDYKSGSELPSQRQIESGTSLQLPVYIMAAQHLLDEHPHFAAAGYFQTKDPANCAKSRMIGHADRAAAAVARTWRSTALFDDEALSELLRREREAIGRAVDGVESGRFAVTTLGPDVAGCRSCDCKHLCRYTGITIRTLQDVQ